MQEIPFEHIHIVASQLIVGASESIDAVANLRFGLASQLTEISTEDIYALADRRLRLRTVVAVRPGALVSDKRRVWTRFDSLHRNGWDVRLVPELVREPVIIVDREVAIVSAPRRGKRAPSASVLEGAEELKVMMARFDQAWANASPLSEIYTDPSVNDSAAQEQLLVVSEDKWTKIIQTLASRPQLMHALSPSDFEELVAELLTRQGCRISLTPRTRDGGRDVLAFLDTPVGQHLYLVECKRFAPTRPVGVQLVRQLYGVVEQERATAGLLVTTSRFTKEAERFSSGITHRLGLKDYQALVKWLTAR